MYRVIEEERKISRLVLTAIHRMSEEETEISRFVHTYTMYRMIQEERSIFCEV
jgi:hypothetical protein